MNASSKKSAPFLLLICFFSLGVSACSESEVAEPGVAAPVLTTPPFDEDAARDNAVQDSSALTFEEVGDTSTCTDDCSGHDAGFEWGKENDITNESDCGGNSTSFIEGCESYARSIEENVDEERDNYENGAAEE